MILFCILAIYSLSFVIRNISGPLDLLSKIRNKLMSIPKLGVFFYELLNCPWCIGFHSGYIIYLLFALYLSSFSFPLFFIWALAGSAITYFGDKFVELLETAQL